MSKYLSKENLNLLFENISNDLKTIGINVESNEKFKKITRKLMKSIYSQSRATSGEGMNKAQLNNYSVQKIKPFLLEMYQKEQSNSTEELMPGLISDNLGFDLNNTESPSELDSLFQNAMITNNNPIVDDTCMTTDDFSKKLEEVTKDRGYNEIVQNTETFRETVNKANKETEKNLELRISNKKKDNEFFQNLYTPTEPPDNKVIDTSFAEAYGVRKNVKEKVKESNTQSNELLKKRNNKAYQTDENSVNNPYMQNNNDISNLLKKITVNNKDHSRDNEIKFNESKSTAALLADFNRENKIAPKLFENTQSSKERINKQMLVIDTGTSESSLDILNVTNRGSDLTKYWYKWSVDINIPLKVDTLSEVYLESMTINGHTLHDNCAYFCLQIDKINIQNYSNNDFMRDNFVIPNNSEIEFYDPSYAVHTAQGVTEVETEIRFKQNIVNVHINDSIYLVNGDFVGNVTQRQVTGTHYFHLDKVRVPLLEDNNIFIGRHKTNSAKFELGSNYVGTINPKNLLTMEFTLTNENGETAETDNNKVFKDSASDKNRVILEFLIVSRNVEDFN